MLQLKHWLALFVFPGDEIRDYRARYFRLAILATLLGSFILLVANSLGNQIPTIQRVIIGLAAVLDLAFLVLLRHGKNILAELGLVASFLVLVTWAIINLGTIRAPSAAIYLLIIVVSGWLFETRGLVITTLLSSLIVLGLIFAENAGLLPTPNYAVSLIQWITYTLVFLAIALSNYIGLKLTRQADARAERELAERKRAQVQLHDVIANNVDGMVVLDDAGMIQFINPAATQMLGKPADQLLARPFELLDEIEQSTELGLTNAGGEYRTVEIRVAAIQWAGVSARLVSLRDSTGRKQMQAQATEQQHTLAIVEEREKIARELHDGVVQVIGYIHLQTSTALEQLTSQQISLAEATLSNIRDIALDAHADIHDFILGVRIGEKSVAGFFPALEHYLEQFQANYHLPITLSKPAVWHDGMLEPNVQVRLLRMIQEALTNTRKHAQASSVRMTFTLPGDMVQVIVADNGCGFTPLPLERRKPDKTTAHYGLAMMTQRVAEISGTLEIRSVIGQGTQVIIQVPRASKTSVRMNGLRVLIADDQRLFREGLNTLLTARGVQVVGIAANGQEALEQTRQLKPDLVLLDVAMPEMDGIVALKQIKAEMPETKVVLLTGFDAEQPVFDAINAGANGYLLKTISSRDLFEMLERVAGGEMLVMPDLAARVVRTMGSRAQIPVMTAQQKKILALIAQGKTNKEIANELVLTEAGVKYHVRQILERLQVETREEAVALAQKRGWVNP